MGRRWLLSGSDAAPVRHTHYILLWVLQGRHWGRIWMGDGCTADAQQVSQPWFTPKASRAVCSQDLVKCIRQIHRGKRSHPASMMELQQSRLQGRWQRPTDGGRYWVGLGKVQSQPCPLLRPSTSSATKEDAQEKSSLSLWGATAYCQEACPEVRTMMLHKSRHSAKREVGHQVEQSSFTGPVPLAP